MSEAAPILRVSSDGLRFATLIAGATAPLDPKTAGALARYRPERLSAILDPERAGRSANEVLGVTHPAPVVADLSAAAGLGANALLLGTAPVGGRLPPAWRAWVLEAIGRGWEVWSGLHDLLALDAEFAAAALHAGTRLVDLRWVPETLPVASARAASAGAHVVLTVGSDCNVGKMTVAWEIAAELSRRGERAAFVATGQTGILLSGWGLAVDRMRADFIAGAAELLVLEAAAAANWVVVEGQGALGHPGYSGVTLGLLHGAAPESLILCHQPTRSTIRHGGLPIPSLERLVSMYEEAAEWVRPALVLGVALNTHGLDPGHRSRARADAHAETGLAACDVLVEGAGPLVDSLLRAHHESAVGGGAA